MEQTQENKPNQNPITLTQQQRNAIIISVITIMSFKPFKEIFLDTGKMPIKDNEEFFPAHYKLYLVDIQSVINKFKRMEDVTIEEIKNAIKITDYISQDYFNHIFQKGTLNEEIVQVVAHAHIMQAIICNEPQLLHKHVP